MVDRAVGAGVGASGAQSDELRFVGVALVGQALLAVASFVGRRGPGTGGFGPVGGPSTVVRRPSTAVLKAPGWLNPHAPSTCELAPGALGCPDPSDVAPHLRTCGDQDTSIRGASLLVGALVRPVRTRPAAQPRAAVRLFSRSSVAKGNDSRLGSRRAVAPESSTGA